jgi:hypothetical protein
MDTFFEVTDYTVYPEYVAYKALLPSWRELADEQSCLRALRAAVHGESIDRPAPIFSADQLADRARRFGYDEAQAQDVYNRFAVLNAQVEAAKAAWGQIYVTLP